MPGTFARWPRRGWSGANDRACSSHDQRPGLSQPTPRVTSSQEGTMPLDVPRPGGQPPPGNGLERNHLEVIRFASRDDCRRAIGVLLERGMLNSTAVNQWAVRTDVVR